MTPSPKDATENDLVAKLLARVKAEAMRFAPVRPAAQDGLRESDQPVSSFGSSANQGDSHSSEHSNPSTFVPDLEGFQVVREIGRGGMGIVYEAVDEVLGRRVALKVLPATAHLDVRHIERFKREAKAAAKLHHSNIVPVFGVGQQGDRYFYVMQYIDGQGLDAVVRELRSLLGAAGSRNGSETIEMQDSARSPGTCNDVDRALYVSNLAAELAESLAAGGFARADASLDAGASDNSASNRTRVSSTPLVPATQLRRAFGGTGISGSSELSAHSDFTRPYFQCVARIGRQAADALDYAHRQGVLHRDIKPSNLLVDSQGIVWVTDFGLAKTAESDGLTETGEIFGTVRYLAPERFEGSGDSRSDVYCLGLTLYELVALRPAFSGTDRYKVMQQIQQERPLPLRELNAKVPPDLETIIHKSIFREPARRYATAAALAEDLGRFLESRPILARRSSMIERAGRWCRRNPWIAASMVTLLAGVAVSTWQAIRAKTAERAARIAQDASRTERNRAESQAKMYAAVNDFLNKDLLSQASPDNQAQPGRKPDPDLKVRTALERASEKIGARFAKEPVVEASIQQTIAETYLQLGLYPQALSHAKRALELRLSTLGENHVETLRTKLLAGTVLLSDGRLSEAEPIMLEAMESLTSVPGPERLLLLDATQSVAQLYFAQGKLVEAERLLIQVRAGYADIASATPLQTLSATNTLAMVYEAQKRPEKAKPLLLEVVRDAPRELGREHPLTLAAFNNLATVAGSLGSNAEAMKLLEDVLRTKRSVLGDQHPDTLYAMVTLAESYLSQSRMDQAETLLLEALAGCRIALDRNHETTDGALAMLAVIYSMKPDLQKLGPVLIEAAQITRSRYGPDHELTAAGNWAAAKFFLLQKNYVRAESYLRERLAYYVKKSPADWSRFVAETELAGCLISEKKYDEAELLLRSAYDGMKSLRSNMSLTQKSELRATLEQTVRLYDATGRKDIADDWRRKLSEFLAGPGLTSKN